MKKFLITTGIILCFLIAGLISSCERIDAGHEGILVNLYGDSKGVNEVSQCTGWVFYNPISQQVYEYPTFVQTVDYEAFTINAKDGSEFIVDPTISLKIVDGKSPEVFKKYRKELKDVINTTLYNYVKNAFRIQLNNFTTDYIVSNRDSIENAIENYLRKDLLKENFQLEQLTSGLKYPETIVKAVNEKNRVIQEAQKAQNEVVVAEANAKKLVIAAEAEAQANKLREQSLTPLLIQQQWIQKWDGKLPTYGNVPNLMKSVQ
jgi:regulator of protease activity HflC (stomatin/prohibitin superfamily)